MMEIQELLAQSGLFAGLPPDQLALVEALASEVMFSAGDVLFDVSDRAERTYILVAGKVAIQVMISSQPDPITTTVLTQIGQLVGWSGLVENDVYTARALCQADSRLLVIDGAALMGVLEAHPAMGFVVMRRVAEVINLRLRNLRQHVLGTV